MGWRAQVMALPGLLRGLDRKDLREDPIEQFRRWFAFAKKAGVYLPNAMALASVDPEGRPSLRMMLLKGVDAGGFVFFTNYESRKGRHFEGNPQAAITMHWVELHRQVRIEGRLEKVSKEESDRYFQSRPRGSRLGAWASRQSEVIPDRGWLKARYREFQRQYEGGDIPLPPFWGGFRLLPDAIEFWQGRPSRLHDRFRYEREDQGWRIVRLSP
jgi:pyridoxamine 5'-phosphate oxidase